VALQNKKVIYDLDVIIDLSRNGITSPPLLYPVPTGVVRAIFILSDTDELKACIKDPLSQLSNPDFAKFSRVSSGDPCSVYLRNSNAIAGKDSECSIHTYGTYCVLSSSRVRGPS
jgi:hypothetical protein